MPTSPARRAVLAVLLGATGTVTARAQGGAQGGAPWPDKPWPDKPVTLVIGYGAGGATDVIGRVLAERAAPLLGQPVVVQNVTGAGGTIASDRVAKAPPDGYAIGLIANAHAVAPGLYPRLPYDSVADFAPVFLVGHSANVLVVPAGSPDRDLAWLAARGRASAEPLRTGSAALAGWQPAHQLMKEALGLRLEHIAYRSGPQGQADLIAGRLDFMVSNVLEVAEHVRAGRLRALAVTSPARSPLLPEVPTFGEAGVPALRADSWFGVIAPRATPAPVLDRLHDIFAAVVAMPEVAARLAAMGVVPAPMTRAEWTAFFAEQVATWSEVPRRAGVRAE